MRDAESQASAMSVSRQIPTARYKGLAFAPCLGLSLRLMSRL